LLFTDQTTPHRSTLSLHDALPISTACFAAARDYVKQRKQFGKPLGAFQLVQEKLARMYTDIGLAQLACVQLARLKERDALTPVQDRKSTRLNSSHVEISYAVFCLK